MTTRPTFILLCLILLALPSCNMCERQASEEIKNYSIRSDFAAHLGKVRWVDGSLLPSDVRGNVGGALHHINVALKKHHGVESRFRLFDKSADMSKGVVLQLIPWDKGKCSTSNPGGTIGWVEVLPDRFTVRVCVDKIRLMLRLRGGVLLQSNMAQRVQAWDTPWLCVLAHEILHVDLPDHINRGGTEGLMYGDSPDASLLKLRQCQISDHEMKIWGLHVKPMLSI